MGVTALAWVLVLGMAEPQSASAQPEQTTPRKLDLGPYGAPPAGRPKVETLTDTPRFESTIDVEGKLPPDFNRTMAVWWAHFNFTSPSVYGRGTAFRHAPPKGSVDITPLIGWAADKVRDYKRNRKKPPKIDYALPSPDASPSPEPSPTPKP
jgi:hypothetical protein